MTPLPIGSPIPSLAGATEWINVVSQPNTFNGHPLFVQFWAISCPICKMNMPAVREFRRTYAPQGLGLVSVHMPRMEADMNIENVRLVMDELEMDEPCAIDNAHAIGTRFQTNGAWPYYFFFDAAGHLRSRAAGALGLKMAENSLKRLLGTVGTEPAGAAS